MEDQMAQDAQSYFDMMRKFAGDFGLPKVDVEKLIDTHRKNIEALGQSAKVAAGGAQSVAQKQREVLEAGLREASELARSYQPLGEPQQILAKQTEFAKKVFDIALRGAQDSAQLTRQSTSEAVKIIQERMKESLEEIRGSMGRGGGLQGGDKP
jgi:phasin family protein